jgi:putative radical SAM enzyme (TIGR03279 family)
MMKNPNAKDIFPIMKELADAGILLRAQIVLCKNINDGDALLRSMTDLKSLYPAISSVSVVHVGLTKYRDGLEKLEPFEKEDSQKALDLIEAFGDQCLKELGTRLIYPSDEFFLSAERPIPSADYYEDFEQIENGVGMLARYEANLTELMDEIEEESCDADFTMITGKAAAPFFENKDIPTLSKKLIGMKGNVHTIRNDFFGERITVAGLITGRDVIDQLKDKPLGKFLLVPTVMLRDDSFLDDVTVADIERELDIPVIKCGPEPCHMYEAITGKESPIQQ